LPLAGQPENFSGAVGKFTIEQQMPDTSLNQYEPATIKLLIKGTGNFPLVIDPEIHWPKEIKASQPQVTEDINKYVYPLAGVKIFQYSLETSDSGRFTVPAIPFSYFDPSVRKYKTIETIPVTYTVAATPVNINVAKNIVIKSRGIPVHFYYLGIVALGIIGLIIFQLVRREKKKAD
jgi:hypothetical protein